MSGWLRANPPRFKRLVWSNARMCILSGLNLEQSPSLPTSVKKENLALLHEAPSGTLVFWDDRIGPDWFGLTAREIENAGYRRIRTRNYSLAGLTGWTIFGGKSPAREIELSLLYKP
jgi:hypothetical protein